jgi:hypothetical protein
MSVGSIAKVVPEPWGDPHFPTWRLWELWELWGVGKEGTEENCNRSSTMSSTCGRAVPLRQPDMLGVEMFRRCQGGGLEGCEGKGCTASQTSQEGIYAFT